MALLVREIPPRLLKIAAKRLDYLCNDASDEMEQATYVE